MIKSFVHIWLIYCLCGLPPSHKATLLYFRGHRPRYARPPRSYSRFMQPIFSPFCPKVNFFPKILAYVRFLLYLCSRFQKSPHAALAELVDALDLGSSFERSEGSSPLCRTSGRKTRFLYHIRRITTIFND